MVATQQWPADQVERRALASLIPQARNARKHSDEQIEQLVASIREWGWTIPVLIDESGTIIAGHGRVQAAARLKLDQVPCLVARGWSDAQKRAYVLADNQLPLNASWDDQLLTLELADLDSLGFDTSLAGFEPEKELDASPQLTDLKYSVIVRCDSEAQQKEMLERFEGEGLTVSALVT